MDSLNIPSHKVLRLALTLSMLRLLWLKWDHPLPGPQSMFGWFSGPKNASSSSRLTGNLDLPKLLTGATIANKTETGEADESSPTTGVVKLSPKRTTTYVEVSTQLMIQSDPSVDSEGLVRLTVNAYHDSAVRRSQSFAAMTDALTTVEGH